MDYQQIVKEIVLEYAFAFLLLSNLALPSAPIKLDRLSVITTQTDKEKGKKGAVNGI